MPIKIKPIPDPEAISQKVKDRFWSKIDRGTRDQCWMWKGYLNPKCYGSFNFKPLGRVSSHRFAYHLTKGRVPTDLVVDHLCRNRACCNPEHLEPVTHIVNIQRGNSGISRKMATQGMTHCGRGHEYTPENTYINKKTGYKRCKACKNLRHRAVSLARRGNNT
jgi:hypothetical protein